MEHLTQADKPTLLELDKLLQRGISLPVDDQKLVVKLLLNFSKKVALVMLPCGLSPFRPAEADYPMWNGARWTLKTLVATVMGLYVSNFGQLSPVDLDNRVPSREYALSVQRRIELAQLLLHEAFGGRLEQFHMQAVTSETAKKMQQVLLDIESDRVSKGLPSFRQIVEHELGLTEFIAPKNFLG